MSQNYKNGPRDNRSEIHYSQDPYESLGRSPNRSDNRPSPHSGTYLDVVHESGPPFRTSSTFKSPHMYDINSNRPNSVQNLNYDRKVEKADKLSSRNHNAGIPYYVDKSRSDEHKYTTHLWDRDSDYIGQHNRPYDNQHNQMLASHYPIDEYILPKNQRIDHKQDTKHESVEYDVTSRSDHENRHPIKEESTHNSTLSINSWQDNIQDSFGNTPPSILSPSRSLTRPSGSLSRSDNRRGRSGSVNELSHQGINHHSSAYDNNYSSSTKRQTGGLLPPDVLDTRTSASSQINPLVHKIPETRNNSHIPDTKSRLFQEKWNNSDKASARGLPGSSFNLNSTGIQNRSEFSHRKNPRSPNGRNNEHIRDTNDNYIQENIKEKYIRQYQNEGSNQLTVNSPRDSLSKNNQTVISQDDSHDDKNKGYANDEISTLALAPVHSNQWNRDKSISFDESEPSEKLLHNMGIKNIATATGHSPDDITGLLRRVDSALGQSKMNGNNSDIFERLRNMQQILITTHIVISMLSSSKTVNDPNSRLYKLVQDTINTAAAGNNYMQSQLATRASNKALMEQVGVDIQQYICVYQKGVAEQVVKHIISQSQTILGEISKSRNKSISDQQVEDIMNILKSLQTSIHKLEAGSSRGSTSKSDIHSTKNTEITLQTNKSHDFDDVDAKLKSITSMVEENVSKLKSTDIDIGEHISKLKSMTTDVEENVSKLKSMTTDVKENVSKLKSTATDVEEHVSKLKLSITTTSKLNENFSDNNEKLSSNVDSLKLNIDKLELARTSAANTLQSINTTLKNVTETDRVLTDEMNKVFVEANKVTKQTNHIADKLNVAVDNFKSAISVGFSEKHNSVSDSIKDIKTNLTLMSRSTDVKIIKDHVSDTMVQFEEQFKIMNQGIEVLNQRINKTDSKQSTLLTDIFNSVSLLRKTVESQSTTIRQQNDHMKQQNETMVKQSTALKQQSTLLEQQSTMLEQQGKVLEQHSKVLERHSKASKQYDKVSEQQSTVLEQHNTGQKHNANNFSDNLMKLKVKHHQITDDKSNQMKNMNQNVIASNNSAINQPIKHHDSIKIQHDKFASPSISNKSTTLSLKLPIVPLVSSNIKSISSRDKLNRYNRPIVPISPNGLNPNMVISSSQDMRISPINPISIDIPRSNQVISPPKSQKLVKQGVDESMIRFGHNDKYRKSHSVVSPKIIKGTPILSPQILRALSPRKSSTKSIIPKSVTPITGIDA